MDGLLYARLYTFVITAAIKKARRLGGHHALLILYSDHFNDRSDNLTTLRYSNYIVIHVVERGVVGVAAGCDVG